MRMIIAGSRSVPEDEANYAALKQAVTTQCGKPDEIISGGAKGADRLGERLAKEFGIPLKQFIPDWDGKGKGAGFLRNGDMAVYASDHEGSVLVVMWDGVSRGTQQMMTVAQTYGLRVVTVAPLMGEFTAPPLAAGVQEPTGGEIIKPKDITPYIFPQSHSSLETFVTCPRQYEAKYIIRDVKFVQNDAAKWGDEVHIALENFIKQSTPLPTNMHMYQGMADWVVNRATTGGGYVLAERKAAVEEVGKGAAPYSAKTAWLRAKIDVTILYPNGVAEIFDWKTGKVKDDKAQLDLYSGCTLADYREINVVKAGYIWLAHNQISKPATYQRADFFETWRPFEQKYEALRTAYRTGVFNPKPSGLCAGWCDVQRCEFWKPKRG